MSTHYTNFSVLFWIFLSLPPDKKGLNFPIWFAIIALLPMQGSYIGNTTASQAVKAGSTPVPCSRKETPFVYRTNGVSFQLNPPFRMGEIISDAEIPYGDEIRLDGGWVDLISSAKQISSEWNGDFIALCAISSKIYLCFVPNIVNATFAYFYLDSATFGYSFATKNALLSTDKGAFFEWCLPSANDDGFA